MNIIYRIANQNHQNPRQLLALLISIAILSLIFIIAIIGLTNQIAAYSKEPTFSDGVLEWVGSGYNGSIRLRVNGNIYKIEKQSEYSKRTFGVVDDLKLHPLMLLLDTKVGKKVQLEYVTPGKIPVIVQLVIDGKEYINKDIAVNDFIGLNQTTRIIYAVALCILVIIIVLALKGVIH